MNSCLVALREAFPLDMMGGLRATSNHRGTRSCRADQDINENSVLRTHATNASELISRGDNLANSMSINMYDTSSRYGWPGANTAHNPFEFEPYHLGMNNDMSEPLLWSTQFVNDEVNPFIGM